MENSEKTKLQLEEDLERAEKDYKLMQNQLVQQAEELLEISTPVMQVWDGVVLAPLIGTLDSNRTQHFMDVLLQAVN